MPSYTAAMLPPKHLRCIYYIPVITGSGLMLAHVNRTSEE